jgi:hypothetical protein
MAAIDDPALVSSLYKRYRRMLRGLNPIGRDTND